MKCHNYEMLLPYGLTVSRKPPSSQVGEGVLQVLHAGRNPASAASEPSSTPSTSVLRTAEAFQHVYRQRPTSTQTDVQSTLMWCKVVRSDVCQLGLLETSVCPFPIPAETDSAWEQCLWLPTSPSPGGRAVAVGSAGGRAARRGRPRCSP